MGLESLFKLGRRNRPDSQDSPGNKNKAPQAPIIPESLTPQMRLAMVVQVLGIADVLTSFQAEYETRVDGSVENTGFGSVYACSIFIIEGEPVFQHPNSTVYRARGIRIEGSSKRDRVFKHTKGDGWEQVPGKLTNPELAVLGALIRAEHRLVEFLEEQEFQEGQEAPNPNAPRFLLVQS